MSHGKCFLLIRVQFVHSLCISQYILTVLRLFCENLENTTGSEPKDWIYPVRTAGNEDTRRDESDEFHRLGFLFAGWGLS